MKEHTMHMNKKLILIFILSIVTVFSLSASYQLVLQSGHDGIPVDMKWHQRTSTIVSVGEDGRLIVTRPRDQKVLHRFRVSSDRIHNLELDPSNEKAAIVTSKDGLYKVSVWDWDKEEKIFDYELESEPLFTSWSAKGRYLTVGNLGTPSVLVLEGRTGRRLSYLQRLPSLYNAGYIGSTETILMTYAVSGAIRYWDIRSSALKLSTETLPNLQGIKVLQTDSKTTLFAYKDKTLFLINRQTGAVLDQLEIPGMIDVSIDDQNGELDALVVTLAGTTLNEYKVRNERFMPRDFGESNLSGTAVPQAVDSGVNPVKVLRKGGTSYLISRSGSLYVRNTFGFSPIINDRHWKPDSMAFEDRSFYLSRGNKILRFTSDFFSESSSGNTEELNDVKRDEIYTGSLASETGIRVLPGGIVLQWDKSADGDDNGIRRIPFNNPDDAILFSGSGPIEKIDVIEDGRILSVSRSGSIKILNSLTGNIESEYSALGILDAAYSSQGDFLLAGRSSRGRAGTPLERVDVQTRESVPVPDRRFMVYSIVTGPSGIFSLGIMKDNQNKTDTTIIKHNKENPEETVTVISVPGEDLRASILTDPSDGNTIYTSLGGTVRRISNSRKTVFQWDEEVSYLGLRASVLYGLDRDGALVLWNAVTGRSLIKVYFFDDGGWIAIPPGGTRLWASPGAIENVRIYKDGRVIDPSKVSQTLNDTNPFS